MATITKVARHSGCAYKALVRLRGIKPFSKTFKRKADAKAWAERMERNIDQARAHGNAVLQQMTLGELIQDYIDQWTGKANGTVSALTWWKQEYGGRDLNEIDAVVVREALKILAAGEARVGSGRGKSKGRTKGIGRKRSPATVNRYKAVLSAVFEYGREHFELPENPCRQVRACPTDNARIRFLSDAEQRALLDQCQRSEWPRLYLLVLLAITTGARQGELLRLRWRDLKLAERRAYVAQTKNGEPRVLPLVDGVVAEINGLVRPLDADTLLFPSSHDVYQPFEFKKHWMKAMKAAELKNFRFHDLRHTCASMLAQNGATLLQIADVLGHKQLEVTKRYAHLCIDHKQALVDQIMGGVK